MVLKALKTAFLFLSQRQADNFVEAVLALTNVAYLPDKFAKLL